MDKWNACELQDVCSRLSSGKGIRAKNISESGLYPVYGGNGLRGYTDTYNFDGECAIIGRQGANCGNVRFFQGKAYMTEHAVVVCANEKNDTRFLAYILGTMQLGRLSAQSAQPGLSVKTLGIQPLNIPDLPLQKRISSFLGDLDDKIAYNLTINKNLADILQSIYRQKFSTSAQNILADVCSYSKERISVDNLTLADYFSTENMLPNKAGANLATGLPTTAQTTKCHVGDVLVSNIRPYFKKILYCYRDSGCSNDVLCFVPKSKDLSAFLYCTLYTDKFFDFMVAGAKGTKMPRGDKQQIMKYPIVLPSSEELNEYNSLAVPMLQKIYNNNSENARLTKIRDVLIPRLMSGEIDVSSIES